MKPIVLWIGAEADPFTEQAYERCVAHAEVTRCAHCEQASELLAAERVVPSLIVFQQIRPGEISNEAVEHCRRLAPTAGVVVVLGNWCEGETRSGTPLVGALRLYASQAAAWFEQQFLALAAGHCPAWGWHSLRAVEDGWLDDSSPLVEIAGHEVLVVSASQAMRETLARWLVGAGCGVESCDPRAVSDSQATLALWDLGGGENEPRWLVEWLSHDTARRAVALTTFPRADNFRELVESHRLMLLGKPASLEFIAQSLQLLRTRSFAL